MDSRFAANRAMYYDRETHFETVKSRQKLLGARVINSFEISRQLDGKSYYYCHYAENHEDGHVADYVFDERVDRSSTPARIYLKPCWSAMRWRSAPSPRSITINRRGRARRGKTSRSIDRAERRLRLAGRVQSSP